MLMQRKSSTYIVDFVVYTPQNEYIPEKELILNIPNHLVMHINIGMYNP